MGNIVPRCLHCIFSYHLDDGLDVCHLCIFLVQCFSLFYNVNYLGSGSKYGENFVALLWQWWHPSVVQNVFYVLMHSLCLHVFPFQLHLLCMPLLLLFLRLPSLAVTLSLTEEYYGNLLVVLQVVHVRNFCGGQSS